MIFILLHVNSLIFNFGIVVQLVRASPCHGERCGFESRQSRQHFFILLINSFKFIYFKLYTIINVNLILTEHYFYMIEPLLFGIVMGMISVSLAGLFVAAFLQYRRGNQLTL